MDMEILTASATQVLGVCSAEKTSEKKVDKFVPMKYRDLKFLLFFMASISAKVDSLFPVFLMLPNTKLRKLYDMITTSS